MILYDCPHCDSPLEADTLQAGDEAQCPICHFEFQIPSVDELGLDDTAVLTAEEQAG